MKKLVCLFALLLSLVSCKKHPHEDVFYTMSNSWVESTQRKDTIEFGSMSIGPIFILKRGVHTNAGYYEYSIKNDTIYARGFYWNISFGLPYYFQWDTNKQQFKIGNFYDKSKARDALLTFTKLP